ncbi:DUF1028 domain-containing protein [Halopseudomonas laoshanensis]|uniref:DUF1028 domain-containing protein n=1 Tax=Halopseudomonas laoshanensis TaxID=2268758 RepID=UPI00293439E4|nr:DUF1028 domain-containing protein [Pseudomonas sp. NyZ704]
MTFSIVARCPHTGQIGVAASTAVQAVGKLACHAVPRVGAVASQALVNPYLAYDALRLLEQDVDAATALKRVLALESLPESRQVGIVDRKGRVAAWTGLENIPWAGHIEGKQCMIQGSRLVGPWVIERMLQVMHDLEYLSLAERMVRAIQAGAVIGGDRLGERSVNIMVFGAEEYPLCDIRIDDHDQPMLELERLFTLYKQKVLPAVLKMPRRAGVPACA